MSKEINNVEDALRRYVGRDVVIEGIFPIPIGQTNASGLPITVYSPVRAKLLDVYSGGFDAVMEGYKEPQVFVIANVRSVMPIPRGEGLVLPGPITTSKREA